MRTNLLLVAFFALWIGPAIYVGGCSQSAVAVADASTPVADMTCGLNQTQCCAAAPACPTDRTGQPFTCDPSSHACYKCGAEFQYCCDNADGGTRRCGDMVHNRCRPSGVLGVCGDLDCGSKGLRCCDVAAQCDDGLRAVVTDGGACGCVA